MTQDCCCWCVLAPIVDVQFCVVFRRLYDELVVAVLAAAGIQRWKRYYSMCRAARQREAHHLSRFLYFEMMFNIKRMKNWKDMTILLNSNHNKANPPIRKN